MQQAFTGKWRAKVVQRNAGFSQRVVVSGASLGNGNYQGVVGNSFIFENGMVELQWNNGVDSGWQPSAVTSAIGTSSSLVVVRTIAADDNFPGHRDGDYDDLVVSFEHLDAAFKVVQRPFALDRGSLIMFPDGIFDTSQGMQYMGVRIKNTWFFNWTSVLPPAGIKIGIDKSSRTALASQGITIIDTWTPQEQQALGQVMDGGYVRVPDLKIGEETTIYFKIDVTNSNPSKPDIGFVAQRDVYDPNYNAPSRIVHKKIFISKSTYDKVNKELVTSIPEGNLHLKMNSIKLDLKGANDAAKKLMACLKDAGNNSGTGDGGAGGGKDGWWEDCSSKEKLCREQGSKLLRQMLKELMGGVNIDICKLRDLIDLCCKDNDHDDCKCHDGGGNNGDNNNGYPGGGWQDGTGVDGWCRVKPVAWLPVSFEYRIEPNPAYTGQYGPLAFEDPWWKVILIIIAILLYVASLIYDYIEAGQDPRFIIGKILRNGDAMTNAIDCAVCNLNGSRGVNLGEQDAQSDDVNNGLPVEGLGNIIDLDRTDNGDFGIIDAVVGNVVWKSGGRSGTTRGFVNMTNFATNVNYDTEDTISGVINFTNQVQINQISGMEQPVSQAGDSGSVWVDLATKRPIALNFAGDIPDAGTEAIGNPIRAVVNQLDIRFNN